MDTSITHIHWDNNWQVAAVAIKKAYLIGKTSLKRVLHAFPSQLVPKIQKRVAFAGTCRHNPLMTCKTHSVSQQTPKFSRMHPVVHGIWKGGRRVGRMCICVPLVILVKCLAIRSLNMHQI